MRVKTPSLFKPKFPSAQFFEWTQRKGRKVKKFQKGHDCILKIILRPKNLIPAVRINTANLT